MYASYMSQQTTGDSDSYTKQIELASGRIVLVNSKDATQRLSGKPVKVEE